MLRKVHVNVSGMKTFILSSEKKAQFQEQVLMTVLYFNIIFSAFLVEAKGIQIHLRFMESCYCHQAAYADDY